MSGATSTLNKKRKPSLQIFESRKELNSPSNSTRTGGSTPTTPIEFSNQFNPVNSIGSSSNGIYSGGGLEEDEEDELQLEVEVETVVTNKNQIKNGNNNFNSSSSSSTSSLPYTTTSPLSISTSTSILTNPLNSLTLLSPKLSSTPSSSTSINSIKKTTNNLINSNSTSSTSKMMDQLAYSPYLQQDLNSFNNQNNNNNGGFNSNPSSPGSYAPQSQVGGMSLNSLHSDINALQQHHQQSLQQAQQQSSSYFSPSGVDLSSPGGGSSNGSTGNGGDAFLQQLAQLSNAVGNGSVNQFSNNNNHNNLIPDLLSPSSGLGIGMIGSGISGLDNSGLGGMKGKGRETIDANGQIIREVATRRGDDLGIGLGDFDMLDTLGTGTFGKVLLARHHPPTPSGIRSQTAPAQFYAVKVLEKLTVVRLRQVEHLNSERSTLAHVSHPFIVNLLCTFQDERNLYLLLEYVQGGELFSHLRRAGRFSSDVARFYAANLILALEYLHSQDIIYRDLKPENLLIDGMGYIKITDFGFAKHVTDRTYTLCGTPEYLAPEIITATGHGKAADFWAFGVLLFELLAGYPPFFADNPLEIYEKILTGKFGFPPHIDYVAKDLIKRLLTADLSMRLGNLKNGAGDVKNHRWFEGVDWSAVERKEIRAPIIPQTSTPGDTSNFERYPASPLEDLPGPLRAHRARQYQISPDSLERGQDPYGYLFPCF